ncbi:hypothetical protein QBC32DRAFT_333083 [Pseudoneurospora amorphoporcata]|uniref:Secreted protein n=1 Tax=Pseudoneurospora amorphoporcata TaxID=241081 RepID=A0AAN6SJ63_9PEZI|nr:hypothetical protein QBC32DRAFT_333083 [Pseudoneurospora amorphoporcata]
MQLMGRRSGHRALSLALLAGSESGVLSTNAHWGVQQRPIPIRHYSISVRRVRRTPKMAGYLTSSMYFLPRLC